MFIIIWSALHVYDFFFSCCIYHIVSGYICIVSCCVVLYCIGPHSYHGVSCWVVSHHVVLHVLVLRRAIPLTESFTRSGQMMHVMSQHTVGNSDGLLWFARWWITVVHDNNPGKAITHIRDLQRWRRDAVTQKLANLLISRMHLKNVYEIEFFTGRLVLMGLDQPWVSCNVVSSCGNSFTASSRPQEKKRKKISLVLSQGDPKRVCVCEH